MTAPMTAPPPAPAEAANRALVTQQALYGANAQAAPMGNASQAMQTAMARGAGVNAPEAFNATQAPVIANPFARGDAQLAANNAGAGGVLGAYNTSTADYLQKANAAMPLQMEITRRAVQHLAQQHEFDAKDLQVKQLDAEARLAAAKALADPNSPEAQRKAMEDQVALGELKQKLGAQKLQQEPSTPAQISGQTGLSVEDVNATMRNPNFASDINDLQGKAEKLHWSAPMLEAYAASLASQQKDANGNALSQADQDSYAHVLAATIGPTTPQYDPTSVSGVPPLPAPRAPGTVAGPSAVAPPPVQAAMTRAALAPPISGEPPPFITQVFGSQGVPGVQAPPSAGGVGMSDSDTKKLAKKLAASTKK